MNELERMAGPETGSWDAGANTRILQHLWRGKWLVLALTVLSGLVGLEYLKGFTPFWDGLTPRYRATARLILSNREVDLLRGEGQAGTKPISMLNQQRALIRSEAILLPLSREPELQDLRHVRVSGKPLLACLNESLQASIDTRSDLLSIHFESPFPEDATLVVDAAVRVYLEHHRAKKLEETRQLIDLLNQESADKEKEREVIEQQISDLKRQHLALIGSSGNSNLATERLKAASQALTEASQRIVRARAANEAMREARAESRERFLEYGAYYRNTTPSPVLEAEIAPITSERIEAEKDYAERLSKGSTETLLRDKLQQIEFLREREQAIIEKYAETYLRSTEITLREAEREEQQWKAAYLGLEDDVLATEEAAKRLSILESKRATVDAELSQILERIGELGLAEGTGALNIDVMERARVGGQPVFPDPVQVLGIAIAIGLFGGLAFVLLRGSLDRHILAVDEVPGLLGTSVLAVFPRVASGRRQRIGRIVQEEQGSLAAEAVRTVRTAVSFGLPHGGRGVVLVTSSVAGEGKSITASNLALALAQAGRRTVLVDADLRSPGQNEIHDVAGRQGVGDVLVGGISTRKAILQGVARNLDLLPAGESHGRAAELVEGANMRELMNWLRKQYDCVVVDSSPVLLTSEARVLASLADVTVFVLHLDRSSAPEAVRARDILKDVQAKVLGVLVNGQRQKRGVGAYAGGIAYGSYGAEAYGYGPERQPEDTERVA